MYDVWYLHLVYFKIDKKYKLLFYLIPYCINFNFMISMMDYKFLNCLLFDCLITMASGTSCLKGNNMENKLTNAKHAEKKDVENKTDSPTSHILFGCMMKESLIPLDLEVESSYEVGKGPPQLDVLIIRRTGARWSDSQLEFLPDGVRQSGCKHVILELKYSESINQISIFQTLGYLGSYLKIKKLRTDLVCAFLISSKTPRKDALKKFGFEHTNVKGVYRSKEYLLRPLQLISLNELSDAPYNLWIKLFSSKIKQKLSVLKKILSLDFKRLSRELILILLKILNFWNDIGEITMQQIKKDVLYELGGISDEVLDLFLSSVEPKKVINRFKPEDRLQGLDLKTIENYLKKTKKINKIQR